MIKARVSTGKPRRSRNFIELIDPPMGPDTGGGGGFRPTGHGGVHTVPGVGRESYGLDFGIARSSTGDHAGPTARFGCFSTSVATAGGH